MLSACLMMLALATSPEVKPIVNEDFGVSVIQSTYKNRPTMTVVSVKENSPGYFSGLQPGDQLCGASRHHFADNYREWIPMTRETFDHLLPTFGAMSFVGDLAVYRPTAGVAEVSLCFAGKPSAFKASRLGIRVLDWDDEKGLEVASVLPCSVADEAGFLKGMILVSGELPPHPPTLEATYIYDFKSMNDVHRLLRRVDDMPKHWDVIRFKARLRKDTDASKRELTITVLTKDLFPINWKMKPHFSQQFDQLPTEMPKP